MKIFKFSRRFFSKQFAPLLSDDGIERSHRLTVLIFAGTFFAISCLDLILFVSMTLFDNAYIASRLSIGILILIYLLFVAVFIKRKSFNVAAWMLILLYCAISLSILIIWSINAPVGILTLAFVIFLSSIMLGTKYIIPVTLGVIVLLCSVQILTVFGVLRPDLTALSNKASFADVASYSTIFGVYALIAWIAGSQRKQAIRKMEIAEKDLQRERDQLETKLVERTQLLRKSQFEEMRQLYHFAELGQLTTVILHELSNNLSILNLDIDDLKNRHQNSISINRAQESIKYLDSIVTKVRLQLKQSHQNMRFSPQSVLNDAIHHLAPRAALQNIKIELDTTYKLRSIKIYGDPLRLSQILIILMNNSIDAYSRTNSDNKKIIRINLRLQKNNLEISITDYGPGIPAPLRSELFVPHISSKQNGLGVGLFIAYQIIETHFKGKLRLSPDTHQTQFLISIPIPKP